MNGTAAVAVAVVAVAPVFDNSQRAGARLAAMRAHALLRTMQCNGNGKAAAVVAATGALDE